MKTTKMLRKMAVPVWLVMIRTSAYFVAEPGSTNLSIVGLRVASGTVLTTPIALSVFGLPGSYYPLSLLPSIFLIG